MGDRTFGPITATVFGRDGRPDLGSWHRRSQYIAEGYGWCIDFDLEKFF